MKSKITIDVDDDNQPIIKIDYVYSEDVRDTLVKKFLETFGSISSWSSFHYTDSSSAYGGVSRTANLRPLKPWELDHESRRMIEIVTQYDLKNDKPYVTVEEASRGLMDLNK